MAAATPPAPLSRERGAAALSDAQIERFSRQIVLPEIGGTGQARLLATSVLLLGNGPLAEMAALYLAGGGIGRIGFVDANGPLATAVADLNPDVTIENDAALDVVRYDVAVACDASPSALVSVAAGGRPIIAAGLSENGGWLAVAEPARACASCIAHRHGEPHPATGTPFAGVAAGVLGSLIALQVVKLRLGHGAAPAGELHFDVVQAAVTEHPIARHPECPVCANASVT